MKKFTIAILVCLISLCSFGQQLLELKIKQSSDLPNTANEHLYLIELTNDSNSSKEFTVVTNDFACSNRKQSEQVTLVQQCLNRNKTIEFKSGVINANSSIEFYIKISRERNTPLGKWNCTEVNIISNSDERISNTLVITSQIPDPTNFK